MDETEVENLVRRAIQLTYPVGKLERDIDYVDVRYERFHDGSHLLRARAPTHDILAFERWLVVTVQGKEVRFRGAGQASPTEFYVRARLDGD